MPTPPEPQSYRCAGLARLRAPEPVQRDVTELSSVTMSPRTPTMRALSEPEAQAFDEKRREDAEREALTER